MNSTKLRKVCDQKIKLIAETAWHHDGDFVFMKRLVANILEKSRLDILKTHLTLNFYEYMHSSHPSYNDFKNKLFSEERWTDLIKQVKIVTKI